MKVFIARDGVEIGEFERDELAPRVRSGELRPTDFYWLEGMETWLPLEHLLAPEEEKEPAPSDLEEERTEVEEHIFPREEPRAARRALQSSRNLRLAALCGGTIALLALAAYFIGASRSDRGQGNALLLPSPTATIAPPDADQVRDKAAAELRAKLEQLPAKPEPPLHTFYYGVSVNMRKALAHRVPWTAVIRGGENVVNPETETTTVHTDFILTLDYRDGEWAFQHYRASVSDMVKEQTVEIDQDAKAPAPPSIVGILSLKMPPPE